MIPSGNGRDQQQVLYREIARAIRELTPAVRHLEAREELELLALRYQRLAEFREELSLLHSLPAFTTLFRHAVIAQGQPVPPTKREAIKQLAGSLHFDATPFENLLDVREHRANRSQFQVQDVAARYLAAVEQVTSAVDRMLDSPQGS